SGGDGGSGGPDPGAPGPLPGLKLTDNNAIDSARLVFVSAVVQLGFTLDLVSAAATLHFVGLEEQERPCPDGGRQRLTFADNDDDGVLSPHDEVIVIGEGCDGADGRQSLTITHLAASAGWLTEVRGSVEHELHFPQVADIPLSGVHSVDVSWTEGGENWRLFDGTLSIDTPDL